MKRALIWFAIVGSLGVVVVIATAAVVKVRLATVWPDDPGPVQVPYVVDTTTEAVAAFDDFLGFENAGYPGAELDRFDDPLDAAIREAVPMLGSQIEDDTSRTVADMPHDALNAPEPPVVPVSPGSGLWDESDDFLRAFAAIAEAGTFEHLRSIYDEHVQTHGILDATRLISLRARGWMANGHPQQAAADYLLALNVLRTIQQSSTGLIIALVAVIAEAVVLNDVTALAPQWPTEQRRELLAAIGDRNADPSYLATAMMHEYWFAEESLVLVETSGIDERLDATNNVSPSAIPWSFSPQRTRAMLNEIYRMHVASAMLPPAERSFPEIPVLTEPWGWQLDNGVGRAFIELWGVRQTAHFDHEDHLRTYRDLAVLRLALVEYEATTGAPAEQLTDLVDIGIVSSLPVDRFDHLSGATAGYLYSAERRVLSSDFVETGDTWPSEIAWP